MQKFLTRILCCFIPNRKLRHKIRNSMQRYQIIGSGNKIYIGQTELKSIVPGLNIIISGNNNIIRLPTVPKFENSFIRIIANNVKISISDSTHKMRYLHINASDGDGQRCSIGRNFHCFGVNVHLNEENATLENAIEIGETETLSLRLNGFLATFFSGEQIENILKKEIMQLAQSGGDCLAEINQKAKDYCLEDCIWFSEWIDKKYT